MTKEEFIKNAIKNRKEGDELVMCCGVNCNVCPYAGPECYDTIAYDLLDYIIEHEKHKETNLEHYWDNLYVHFNVHQVDGYLAYIESNMKVKEWLLQPYEESKAKYKLTQFEYDLVRAHQEVYGDDSLLKWAFLKEWQKKGYLKNIPDDVPIKDIIDNCEVIANET